MRNDAAPAAEMPPEGIHASPDIAGHADIYRSIAAGGLEGVFRTTPDGSYLSANLALAKMYGYDSAQELIAAVTQIGHQIYADPERRSEFIRIMKEENRVTGFESQVYKRDGSTIWISENACVVRDAEGNPICYEGTVQDISRRKRAEDALVQSRRFIERVAEASPAILYVYDLFASRYVYANHRVEKILGYKLEEFLEMSAQAVDSMVHPEDAPLLAERIQTLSEAADGQICEYYFRIKNAEGDWVWIQSRDTVFTRDRNGKPDQFLGIAQDVTERMKSRADLEKSREQLRALSARAQQVREEERIAIAREVHDEMGQTLTALNMDISILRARMIDPRYRDLAMDVADTLASMGSAVESMLRTARKISAALRPPVLDEFGLAAAIEWQAGDFQRRFGIRCEVVMNWELTILDSKLSTAVFRIFQEIMTNIARHAKASKVRVELSQGEKFMQLVVTDNGRGISETEKSNSLGLLGMTERALVFDGTIEITGTRGKGTTVTVKIPIAAVQTPDGQRGFGSTPRKEVLRFPMEGSALR